MKAMSSEFDWFMVTMPIFAIAVYAIVMLGSMEKQPKILESGGAQKLFNWAIIGLFGVGMVYSCYYMILRFVELLGNY